MIEQICFEQIEPSITITITYWIFFFTMHITICSYPGSLSPAYFPSLVENGLPWE